jgi:drug/metabolite transporter (DMT)-like permease
MKISKPIQADLALIFITFVWGSTFTIVKQTLAHVSPILFVALRFWLATVVVFAFMPGHVRNISGRTLRQGVVLSLVLTGGFVFQTLGLRYTNPSYSAFITSLSVLLVPLLGYVLYRHRPRLQTIAGIVLATIGLFLLLAHLSEMKLGLGDTLTLICAVMFGFHILFLGRYVATSDYRQLMLLQMAGSAVLCTLAIPAFEKPFIFWNSNLILALVATSLLATAFAFYVQARAQRLTTANHTALIFSLEPFFAALFAFLILGQVLSLREWAGGILVLVGILVSELQFPSRGKDRHHSQSIGCLKTRGLER